MRSSIYALALALVLAFWSQSASATPIVKVDGNLDSNDHYTTTLYDDTGEAGIASNLDIASVTLAGDPETGDAYMGLWVEQGPISTTGAPGSHLGETLFTAVFTDNNSSLTHRFDILMSGNNPITVAEDGVELAPGSFAVAAANGLEVEVHAPDIIALTNFSFYGLLDGRSTSPNDNIYVASVPEPATLSILAIMLGGLAARRTKKQ